MSNPTNTMQEIDEILAEIMPIPYPEYNMGLLPDEHGYDELQVLRNYAHEQDRAEAKQRLSNLLIEAIERVPLDCHNCGLRCTYLEAELRNFNTGMCAACGADALLIDFVGLSNYITQLTNTEGDNNG